MPWVPLAPAVLGLQFIHNRNSSDKINPAGHFRRKWPTERHVHLGPLELKGSGKHFRSHPHLRR